jgi:hypothetical protein
MIGLEFSVQNAKDALYANMEKENQSAQIVMEVMYVFMKNRRINVSSALHPVDVSIVI